MNCQTVRLLDCSILRQMAVAAVLCLASLVLHAYEVTVDTVVANPGRRVAVPVRFDTVKGSSYAGVKVTYDPQVLVFLKAQEGPLTRTISDDYVVWGDEKSGVVSVTAFAKDDVTENTGGVLATLIFEVRERTEGHYSDLAVSDVQIGERTGVKDLAVASPIWSRGGMVRAMAKTASVARLENAQVIGADVALGAVAFKSGDGIQASGAQTPIVVSGTVTADYSRREEEVGYLKAIYDLSRCKVLIGGGNNGTATVYAFSSGFEKFHLFEL